jgi:hypothetical protein
VPRQVFSGTYILFSILSRMRLAVNGQKLLLLREEEGILPFGTLAQISPAFTARGRMGEAFGSAASALKGRRRRFCLPSDCIFNPRRAWPKLRFAEFFASRISQRVVHDPKRRRRPCFAGSDAALHRLRVFGALRLFPVSTEGLGCRGCQNRAGFRAPPIVLCRASFPTPAEPLVCGSRSVRAGGTR